ncbi:MAG: ABC transporter permease [Gammaproteobacteria bacterium]
MPPSSPAEATAETSVADGSSERVLLTSESGSPFRIAIDDYWRGYRRHELWVRLGWMEVKRRYRRTVLGPFWATGHIAVYILCVGFVFSSVLATERDTYIPYLVTGFLAWMFIYNTLQEAGGAFTGASSLLQQIPFPYSMFVYMTIWRGLVVHVHNYVLYLAILLIYSVNPGWHLLLLLPGYALVLVNLVWMCMFLAAITARFRDMQQLIAAIIQVMIFVTPIFWSPEMMSEMKRAIVLTPNLLYHLTIVLRAPLLGQTPPMLSYAVLSATALIGHLLTLRYFGKNRANIIFWIS